MEQAEITALGQSLRQIDQTLLNREGGSGVERIWYQGGEPYFDLFVELSDGHIEWFQMTLRGRSLSWYCQGDRWQTGTTNELRTDDVAFYPASKIIESDQRTDLPFFQLAEAILATRAGDPIFDRLLSLFHTCV
ncbi:hypothetical protein VB712_01585 [Spirulina sp. CCNP1310]|uniref:hypothetical protein n=1 Tax=Spirulina sp. CCNP1310 TaxID=3110249 RepID=UPI002B22145B|nr:hypothetical protein [Spirulina sp. CCNP1310]MEA5417895.1 hypothetical protein [Spirulina sp. CCNP1310]